MRLNQNRLNQIDFNLLYAYLSKVTLAQNSQEVEILQTNLAGLVANLLAWLLLKESINKNAVSELSICFGEKHIRSSQHASIKLR